MRWPFAAALAVAACGTPQIVVTTPLAVVNFAPHDGATNVDPAASQAVCFSEEVDAKAAAGKITVVDEAGAEPALLDLKNADANCVAIGHETLQADTAYRIRVSKGLAARSGAAFATEVTSRFRTARP